MARSLGLSVPASERGTMVTDGPERKPLFHLRGRQSVRRYSRCGRQRLSRRPDGEEDKRKERAGRAPVEPQLDVGHWIRNGVINDSMSIPIEACRIIQSWVGIVQDKDRQQKDEKKKSQITRVGQI